MGVHFYDGEQCARLIATYLTAPQLMVIYERVPVYANVALFVERAKTTFFMAMGTKFDSNEVKVSTVVYRPDGNTRTMVNEEDYCYILHQDGKLRFGRNRKYFECKKRPPKWCP